MARIAPPVPPRDPATWRDRTTHNVAMTARILPYMVALKHSQVEVEP